MDHLVFLQGWTCVSMERMDPFVMLIGTKGMLLLYVEMNLEAEELTLVCQCYETIKYCVGTLHTCIRTSNNMYIQMQQQWEPPGLVSVQQALCWRM